MPRYERSLTPQLILAALLLVVFAASCEEEGPSDVEEPGASTAVTTVVHDSAAVLPPGRDSPAPLDSVDYDGVASGTAMTELYSETGGWIALGSPREVMFDIYCEEASLMADSAVVAADTYTAVRLTLTGFETTFDAGGIVDGTVWASAAVITFASGDSVVVERSIAPLLLGEGEQRTILFDLNSETWLDAAVLAAGDVPAAAVEGAANVIIR